MKISSSLKSIEDIASENGLSAPYVCGGLPRDRVLKRFNDFTDVDITTGDKDVIRLSELINERYWPFVSSYKVMPDGHSQMKLANLKLDFSSNFKVPGINYYLMQLNIKNPTDMLRELYSRDFTVNSLLMTMDLKNILDPLGRGLRDIEDRIVRTNLTPEITLGSQHKRIVRVIYIAAKLDFDVDDRIIDWVRANPERIADGVKVRYLVKVLNKSIKYDKEKVIHLINEMNLWDYIPALPSLYKGMAQNLARKQ